MVTGPSLAQAVSSRGPMSSPTVLALAAGLAEGLTAVPASCTVTSAPVPRITGVSTYRQGARVYFGVHYADPGDDAQGFGYNGVNGTRRVSGSYPSPAQSRHRGCPQRRLSAAPGMRDRQAA